MRNGEHRRLFDEFENRPVHHFTPRPAVCAILASAPYAGECEVFWQRQRDLAASDGVLDRHYCRHAMSA